MMHYLLTAVNRDSGKVEMINVSNDYNVISGTVIKYNMIFPRVIELKHGDQLTISRKINELNDIDSFYS